MNRLPAHTRVLIIRCLVEGMSIRSTARTADVSKNTVLKLLCASGRACAAYQDAALRGLTCRRVEVDEIWSFVYVKQKNAPYAKNPPKLAGDAWTWTAMCPDSKLILSWRIGDRTSATAIDFMDDVRSRLAHRVQLTSDGHIPYLEAVERAFGEDVDYAMLVKHYGTTAEDAREHYRGATRIPVQGNPRKDQVSTSGVERQNLTMRMSMRRFTRRTNAFSKKVENHAHAVALHFMHYNFVRIHRTIECSPAMAIGVDNHLWEIRDLVDMVEAHEPRKAKVVPIPLNLDPN